ncbi:MAG TPA: hypothetical protein VMZ53_34525 [Kofleriaceae bacterium]|nr:hypothetical protein [Kofleriaceae bacterium]
MVREYVPLAFAALLPGCSLILDFSDSAAPHDAAIDAVYTQEQCDYLEPNDSLQSPVMVTQADTGTAAICAPVMGGSDDHDFYRFSAGAVPFSVGIQFTNRPGGDLDMKVYNAADGTLLGQSRGFGDGETLTCPGTSPACPSVSPGDFVVEVFPALAGSVNTYKLVLP